MPEIRKSSNDSLSFLERFLKIFSDIRAGEGQAGILLMVNIFLVLASYYFIKPVREGWLSVSDIGGLSKMEIKAYSSLGQSLILLIVMPVYGYLTSFLSRFVLMLSTTVFLSLNMVVFWFLQPDFLSFTVPHIGIIFYLWVGMFGVTVVAQFWAFAADLYTDEKGKRLFPLIAIGASAGASAGSWMTGKIIKTGFFETYDLILVAIIPLGLAMLLTWMTERRGSGQRPGQKGLVEAAAPPAAYDRRSSFKVILSSRYLLALALLALLINWVNTNGENILYGMVQEVLRGEYLNQGITDPTEVNRFIKQGTTAFYGDLYFWVNLTGLILQAFVVSRLLKYGGIVTILLLTPMVSMLSYGLMAAFPVLGLIRIMKIAENSSNYSVNNTARHVLWLPVPSTVLYKAKTTIDTVFVRLGDGFAALTVMLGTQIFAMGMKDFLLFNAMLACIWILVVLYVFKENKKHSRLSQEQQHD